MIPPDFRGPAIRLRPADLVEIARLGNYEAATLQAVIDVEASGSGYDAAGRPKLLTEPHIFYRELGAGPKRNAAVRDSLTYLSWGTMPYPATSDGNYARLRRMIAVDETAALRSCSWGLGQVCGFNHAACGFPTVQDMVAACCTSEVQQFRCLLSYVEHAKLAGALKLHDWRAFARGYNGSGAVEAYAGKLMAAYARRSGKVVSLPTAAPVSTADALNDAEWLRVRAGVVA